jgi:hypothetical protein
MAVGTLVVAATLVTSCLTVATASADTIGCVTRSEYRNVHKGMSKSRVANVFDTKGTRMSFATSGGYSFEIRNYNTCSEFSAVSIGFDNGHLSNKTAVWVY